MTLIINGFCRVLRQRGHQGSGLRVLCPVLRVRLLRRQSLILRIPLLLEESDAVLADLEDFVLLRIFRAPIELLATESTKGLRWTEEIPLLLQHLTAFLLWLSVAVGRRFRL